MEQAARAQRTMKWTHGIERRGDVLSLSVYRGEREKSLGVRISRITSQRTLESSVEPSANVFFFSVIDRKDRGTAFFDKKEHVCVVVAVVKCQTATMLHILGHKSKMNHIRQRGEQVFYCRSCASKSSVYYITKTLICAYLAKKHMCFL